MLVKECSSLIEALSLQLRQIDSHAAYLCDDHILIFLYFQRETICYDLCEHICAETIPWLFVYLVTQKPTTLCKPTAAILL